MNFSLTRSHSVSSLAIRARLRDVWSHGIVHVSDEKIIDSTFVHGGVRERHVLRALSGASSVLQVHAPLDSEHAAKEWLYAQIGKGYDWRAIWGWITLSREWHDEFAWFCFELIAGQIEAGSSYRFANRNRVTGADLIAAAAALRGE